MTYIDTFPHTCIVRFPAPAQWQYYHCLVASGVTLKNMGNTNRYQAGTFLGMGSPNERRRYIVTPSLIVTSYSIAWAHTRNDHCQTIHNKTQQSANHVQNSWNVLYLHHLSFCILVCRFRNFVMFCFDKYLCYICYVFLQSCLSALREERCVI